jgi:hypothetical protein
MGGVKKIYLYLKMKLILFIIFLPLNLGAQDITGLWTGSLYTSGNELPYELVISREGDRFAGYSLTTFIIEGVENTGLKSMKIKSKSGKVTIEDDELIDEDYSTKPKRVMLFSNLSLTGKDSSLILSGNFNARSYNNLSYKGTIILKRKSNSSQTKLIARLAQVNLLHTLSFLQPPKPAGDEKVVLTSTTAMKDPAPAKGNQFAVIPGSAVLKPAPAADLAKREIKTVQTIRFSSDSLVLSVYDNGQVDGDTVSLVLNGQTIIAQKGLTARPFTHTIYTQGTMRDSLQLVLYAENLGRIPPNTGLLIIQDGNNRHEVRFSGDLQRNSAIILKRQ